MKREKKAPNRRLRWCCCSGCSVVGVAAIVLLLLLMSAPPGPRPLTVAQQEVAARKAREVRQQVETIAQDAREGRSRDFVVKLGQPEVNELLRSDENLQQAIGQVRLRDPYVVIDDGVVGLTATRDVGGVDLTSTVAIRPQLEADGRIGVTVASAHVGRLSIPDALTRRFADRLAEKIEDKANSVRVRIRSLRVEAGRITIEGSTAR